MRRIPLILAGAVLSAPFALGCGGSARDAGADAAVAVARPPDASAPRDPGPPKRLFTKRFVVYVFQSPSRASKKLGYLRAGSVQQAKTAEPVSREGCPGGWFELNTGGFVCNGTDVTAFLGTKLPAARAVQPNFTRPLPYEYGGVRRTSPLYRRPPSDEEAALYEGYVIPGSELDGGAAVAEGATEAAPAAPAETTPPPPAPAAPTLGASVAAAQTTAEPATDPNLPPTLNDLMGERGSVVYRSLMPGFILSLDRTFRAGARRYWRTQQNGFVPYARIGLREGSDFRGVVLDGTEWALPVAFVVDRAASVFEKDGHGRMRPARGRLAYHDRARVVGREDVAGTTYLALAGERFVRAREVVTIEAQPRPAEVGPNDSWVDVDLTSQTLVAYEGDRPVFATLVSTGRIREPGDPELDHRTPTGTFRITSKHVTTTMDGDSAVDGPYSIDDVPYVMYFFQAYALHSAFWHDRFGHTKSHGCVNMAPEDAKHLFAWTHPRLETGWHGAFPTPERPATWVVVRGVTPGS